MFVLYWIFLKKYEKSGPKYEETLPYINFRRSSYCNETLSGRFFLSLWPSQIIRSLFKYKINDFLLIHGNCFRKQTKFLLLSSAPHPSNLFWIFDCFKFSMYSWNTTEKPTRLITLTVGGKVLQVININKKIPHFKFEKCGKILGNSAHFILHTKFKCLVLIFILAFLRTSILESFCVSALWKNCKKWNKIIQILYQNGKPFLNFA